MPDVTLVTQSLNTEITSINEEVEVITITAPTTIVDVQQFTTVIDLVPELVVDVSQTIQTVDVQISQAVLEISSPPLVIPEVDVPLDIQVDEASSTVTYVGQASPGTATSEAKWRIKRITDSGSQITVDWANGTGSAVHVWDDRASLIYGP